MLCRRSAPEGASVVTESEVTPEFLEQLRLTFEDWSQRTPSGRFTREFYAMFCIQLCLRYRLEVPAWAAGHFISSWDRFSDFKAASLGEAFGIEDTKHLGAKLRGAQFFDVGQAVWELHVRDGVPLKSGRRGAGALELVAERFGMCETDVRNTYRGWSAFKADLDSRLARKGLENP